MVRVIRLIVYEFTTQEGMDAQLGRSQADGCRETPGGRILVLTLHRPLFERVRKLWQLWRAQ